MDNPETVFIYSTSFPLHFPLLVADIQWNGRHIVIAENYIAKVWEANANEEHPRIRGLNSFIIP